jgi:hypothetical protein
VDKAPKLPAGGTKHLVEWAPWVSLIVGVLTLWAAWALWHWAHVANGLLNYANDLCNAYGSYSTNACSNISSDRLTFWVWLGIIFLVVEGLLYLLAFPGLRDRKRQGWQYLYYGALVNVVYAVVSLFTNYGVGNFIGGLIGSAVGFWLLFQIRDMYGKAVSHDTPKSPAE